MDQFNSLQSSINNLMVDIVYFKKKVIKLTKEKDLLVTKNKQLEKENKRLLNIVKNQEHLIRTMEKSSVKVKEDGTIIIPEQDSENFRIALKEVVQEIMKDNYVTEILDKLNETQEKLKELEEGEEPSEEEPENSTADAVFELFKSMWNETVQCKNEKVSESFIEYLRKEEYTGKYKLGCLCSLHNSNNPVMWKIVGGNKNTIILQHIVLSAKERIEDIKDVYPIISPDGDTDKEKLLNPNYKEEEESKIIY